MTKIVYKIEMELDVDSHDLEKIHEMGVEEFFKKSNEGFKQLLEFEYGGEDCRVTKLESHLIE
jgi:hypothetical protein